MGTGLYSSFEKWTGRRDLATLGSNTGSTAIPFQRWRHFKEAFAPEIVHEAIHASRGEVRACIDPFGGSGTTALACQFLGIRPTTIEVNPYLADLIEAKLTAYDPERLVRDLGALLRAANRAGCPERIGQLPPTFVEPGIDGRWLFDREAAGRLLAISLAVDGLAAPSHRTLFRVLLGGILVGLSNAVVNGKGRRYRGGWEKRRRGAGDVDLAFTEAATAAIGEIGRFGRRAWPEFALVRGDSRTAIAGLGPFDLAVFSPPYPNSFDYTDVYNIELWMLGYLRASDENRALRQSTLASHVQIHRTFAPPPAGIGAPGLGIACSIGQVRPAVGRSHPGDAGRLLRRDARRVRGVTLGAQARWRDLGRGRGQPLRRGRLRRGRDHRRAREHARAGGRAGADVAGDAGVGPAGRPGATGREPARRPPALAVVGLAPRLGVVVEEVPMQRHAEASGVVGHRVERRCLAAISVPHVEAA